MSQALCWKKVNIKKYFNEQDMREDTRNLDWSLLRKGDIFLTWIILLKIRENLGLDLELQKKRKLNYLKGQTFFQFALV